MEANNKKLSDDQLYSTEDTAAFLACSVNLLAKDRMKSNPIIPYVKLSRKFVRYRGSIIKGVMSDFQAA